MAEFTGHALRTSIDWVAETVPITDNKQAFDAASDAAWWASFYSQLAAGVSGVAGGVFGLPGLAIELPLTMGIMLRSIASIAAEFGADLSDPGVRLAN